MDETGDALDYPRDVHPSDKVVLDTQFTRLIVNIPIQVKWDMSSKTSAPSQNIPKKQRALILQGGGALGAYEVGVFKAIYDKIIREEGDEAKKGLFDIVAGASIGAIKCLLYWLIIS